MNYRELQARANKDFGTDFFIYEEKADFFIYKEKAGFLMLESRDGKSGGTLGNWDCGHSCPSRHSYFEVCGYAYVLIEDVWYRVPDGIFGWRREEENSFGKTLQNVSKDWEY